jgi:hypothetical protein
VLAPEKVGSTFAVDVRTDTPVSATWTVSPERVFEHRHPTQPGELSLE